MIIVGKLSRIAQVDLVKAGQLDGGSLRLFQNDFTPNADSLLAAFIVADFVGYANKTIVTWGAAFLDPTGLATTLAPLQTWTPTNGVSPNTVFGCYFLDAGGDLVWSYRFPNPVYFADANSVFNMVPKFQSGQIAQPA